MVRPETADLPPPARSAPAAGFARDLARSGALPGPRAAELFAAAPAPRKRDAAAFADHLVGLGELTRFQADKLLRGHWRGLAVGPYLLVCPVGRGGMGVVYLARRGADLVALKVLPPLRAREEPRTLARFRREMDIGLRLPPHPHLTRTLDAGDAAGVHYLALEYVPGDTVRELVRRDGPLPVGKATRVFADAAAGLHQAHLAGFVHRDLKPGNVVVTPAGRAKVLDFGFALVVGEPAPTDPTILGGQGYTLGTMDFLPPEQAANAAAVGPAADLYALGCSLYYAVAGCPPFPGGTAQDKIRWHRTDAPPPVTQINPAVPPGLETVINRLMAKDPADRPASADEAARLLLPWADPVRAEPVGERTAEVVRQAEAHWQAEEGEAEAGLDSLEFLDDDPPLPVARRVVRAVRVPRWVVPVAVAGAASAVTAALALGWLAARVLAR